VRRWNLAKLAGKSTHHCNRMTVLNKRSFRLPLLALGSLIIAGLLVASAGRLPGGPLSRGTPEPVFISRLGGVGAEIPAAQANHAIEGPFYATAAAVSFDGDVRELRRVKPPEKPLRPELEVEADELRAMAQFDDQAAQPILNAPVASLNMPSPVQNFDGLDYSTWGAGYPPDTNGDVGPNHYIQTVNTAVGIYSKTGIELASFSFDTLFSGTGTPCDADNKGDPVVLYDAAADRWLVTDFAWTNIDIGPYYECLAASKTNDPVAGGWWLYALRADDPTHNFLNDYPKLGVWPDGIYMSANLFDCVNNCGASTTYRGTRLWAINRDDLYSGAALRVVLFDVGPTYFSLLPSNFRGAAPPVGAPNYFVANDLSVFALDVWKFHVNWVTPNTSTLTGPTQVPIAFYNDPPATIPALGGNGLDSLGTRLMAQNQYKNLGGVESLWIVHTVGKAKPNVAGVRWYQLNVSGQVVNTMPVQQSTFRPDSDHRWMASLAVDQQGNMAIGYSLSSSSVYPKINYAGRLAGDPLNTLSQAEFTLIAGGGSQNYTDRWGDYSAMTIDPVDDCTFWYTNEYYAVSGDNWHTRIGSFKFPGCGGGPIDTATPTGTNTPTPTGSLQPSPTVTRTPTPTSQPKITQTRTATAIATTTAAGSQTQTATATVTSTAGGKNTQTATVAVTMTPAGSQTSTPTPSPTPTARPKITATPTTPG
jgi:hypothetical protein